MHLYLYSINMMHLHLYSISMMHLYLYSINHDASVPVFH